MAMRDHLVNGLVSLIISVVFTAISNRGDEGTYDNTELLLSVAVSSFLSGFFTSYFAKK
jgi:hypothetical protein